MNEEMLAFPGLSKLSQASASFFKGEDARWKENLDDRTHGRHSAAHCIPTQPAGEFHELSTPLLTTHLLGSIGLGESVKQRQHKDGLNDRVSPSLRVLGTPEPWLCCVPNVLTFAGMLVLSVVSGGGWSAMCVFPMGGL